VKPGDFLLTNSMSFGKPYILRTEGCIHDGWLVLSPRSGDVDADYFYHLLGSKAVYAEFERRASGATVKNLNIDLVRGVKVPVPPVHEQRRIAKILDKADELRATRRAATAQLETLAQSIFLDIFGDPARNPKGWPVKRLEDEITSVRYGTGSPPPYVDDGVPFIRATNVKAGTISPKDLKHISPTDAARIDKCRVDAGNLIIVRSGVNTGDCAIVPSEYDGACAAFDLIVELPWANAVFYTFLINSPHGKAHLEPLTRRAAQPHLNAEQVRSLRFISPEQSAKRRFAALVGSINSQRARGDVHLRELDALCAALQHSAFRGEL
ncbi:MAG TPA: restriction endonuclease subunit S, partial [Chromatiales bacterium]|nr:restriction endonuclease subunit S [Chromatiales bacterium]